MDLDDQIEWMAEQKFSEGGIAVLASLRELKRLRRALTEIRELTDATADAAPHIARRALEHTDGQ